MFLLKICPYISKGYSLLFSVSPQDGAKRQLLVLVDKKGSMALKLSVCYTVNKTSV